MTARATRAFVVVEGRKWANANGSHGHWRAHQALMDEWKQRAIIATRASGARPIDGPVVITATVRRTTAAKADAHNVTPTIKACIDAIVACRVLEDDNDGVVARLVIQAGPKATVPTVELEVEAC